MGSRAFCRRLLRRRHLAAAARASDNPIAIACLRLVTFLPDFPLFSLPAFISFMTFPTFSDAFLPYLPAMSLSLMRKDSTVVLSVKAVTCERQN